jgi:hypothetical protein
MKPSPTQIAVIDYLKSGYIIMMHAGYYLIQKRDEFKGVRVTRATLKAMQRKGIINEQFFLTNK